MERIEKIAGKAIETGYKGILKNLDKRIANVKMEASSRGIFNSTVTGQRAIDEIEIAAEELRDLVSDKQAWAIDKCVAFTTLTKTELQKQASDYFGKFRVEGLKRIDELANLTGMRGAHYEQDVERLDELINDAHETAVVELEQHEAVKERKVLMGLPKLLKSLWPW